MENLGRCETCVFWDAQRDHSFGGMGGGVRACNAAPMFWESTRWTADGEGREFTTPPTVTAFVQDGSDYSASLYTQAHHGCTMHSPK